MGLLPTLNEIYATFFGTSLPTRTCVAVHLPPSMRIKLDCFAHAETNRAQRTALRAQAPANIGPYSQVILIDERVFVPGQIWFPPSPQDPATVIAWVFQHAERRRTR